MADYSAARTIIDASRNELIAIFRWVHTRGEDSQRPVTVLIGGWAVYHYNPWYGSIDIDIVTNSRTRQHLMRFLRDERGFVHERQPMIPNTVVKNTHAGQILIDFGSRDDICRFEGREETCPFTLLDGQTTIRTSTVGTGALALDRGSLDRGGVYSLPIVVPTKTLLLLFKLKAAWDRLYRLQNGSSADPEWEQGKLRKDRADILALLDRAANGTDLDLMFLGDMMHQYEFLGDVLTIIPDDRDALQMYGRMDLKAAQDAIENVLRLIG